MRRVWEWGLCDYPPDQRIPGPEETRGRCLTAKPKKPDINMIRRRATAESIKTGLKCLNRDGGVVPLGNDRGLFSARVRDGETHTVAASLGYGRGNSYCTCTYDGQGVCGHVVAALVYASKNFAQIIQDEKRRQQSGAGGILDELSESLLKEFLSEEMSHDPELEKRFVARFSGTEAKHNVRADLDEAYYQMGDAGHYGGSVIFDEHMAAATSGAKKGDYDEAIRICREIVEVVQDNMENVDDSYAHYDTALHIALNLMVDCIERQGPDHRGKRRHISYLHGRAAMDEYGLDPAIEQAMAKICVTGEDRAYLRSLDR